MTIRKATYSDKPELIRLFLEFHKQSQSSLSEFQAQLRAYKEPRSAGDEHIEKFLSGPDYYVYVADLNGALIGYIAGTIQAKPNRVYDKEGYVSHWFLEKPYQGSGLGKQLFDALSKEFTNANCTHLGLEAQLENTKAIKIYEHMGFIRRMVYLVKPLK